MKKESKNSGLRKDCPECGKAVVKNGNFPAGSSFDLMCAYCKDPSGRPTQVHIEIKVKASAEAVKFNGLKIGNMNIIGIVTEPPN